MILLIHSWCMQICDWPLALWLVYWNVPGVIECNWQFKTCNLTGRPTVTSVSQCQCQSVSMLRAASSGSLSGQTNGQCLINATQWSQPPTATATATSRCVQNMQHSSITQHSTQRELARNENEFTRCTWEVEFVSYSRTRIHIRGRTRIHFQRQLRALAVPVALCFFGAAIDLLGAFSSQLHIFVAFAALKYENQCGGSTLCHCRVVGVSSVSVSLCFPCINSSGSLSQCVCACVCARHATTKRHVSAHCEVGQRHKWVTLPVNPAIFHVQFR